ncbi:MAG: tRNA lysidine(34) synthetase TilS [Clostridia bacterium]|nr:tRNA lysidine(34) synthetase TilS [Clostridia bacterium]
MINKVKAAIEKHGMLSEGATVVAAVSGGSDSMAMLFILNSIKAEYGISLIAAHVNHGIRGDSAERDELFVKEKCSEMGVECRVLRADVPSEAKKSGLGLEECGRKIRYEFFNSLGENVIIATAHNLSDRAETFLFNLTRGSTLRGLCSIPAVRGNIIRPLIGCTKDEINAFCDDNSIEYVTDETNADVTYSRNRIRHNVISQLREINSSFEKNASRCIESLNEDEAFLSSLAGELVEKSEMQSGYSAETILSSPAPVMKRALIMIAENEVGVTPEYRSLDNMVSLLKNGGAYQINGGVTVRVRKGILEFPSEAEGLGDVSLETEIVNINETNSLQNFSKQDLEYFLDCDKIHGRISVRSREPGDKITLSSRGCTKTLKKLFNELSVPPEKRDSFAVVSDDKGLLILEGIGVDSRAIVTKDTVRVMTVRIKR